MAKRKKGIKLVLRKSKPITKVAVLVAVVLCTVALMVLRSATEDNRGQYEAMRIQAAYLESRNQELNQWIANVGTVEGIERIARDELGLVFPDTVILTPEN
jgi:cell division protein FtsB